MPLNHSQKNLKILEIAFLNNKRWELKTENTWILRCYTKNDCIKEYTHKKKHYSEHQKVTKTTNQFLVKCRKDLGHFVKVLIIKEIDFIHHKLGEKNHFMSWNKNSLPTFNESHISENKTIMKQKFSTWAKL